MSRKSLTLLGLLVVGYTSAVAAQTNRLNDWESRAWADGRISERELKEWHEINEANNIAYALKVSKDDYPIDQVQTVTYPDRFLDVQHHPWVPMTAGIANAQVEPQARKERWHHSAEVDYDQDGLIDKAVIVENGQQSAIIVYFEKPQPHGLVVWKSDELISDMEIFGAGSRLLVSLPDLGNRILLLYKEKPSVIFEGD